ASLSEINTSEKKLITTEDPIEYRMRGVTQINVNPGIGLTFSRCLRAILRQDPDILLVGEIRDGETAEISIQMALTGHLVFSTLHTNDAVGAVTRLLDMDIEPFLVSSSLEGLIAQRLVRVLCPECKEPFTPSDELLNRVNVTRDPKDSFHLYRPRGCEACRYRGYQGRTAIYEMVEVKESFRRLIVERAPTDILRHEAVRLGMQTMRHDGWKKIKEGVTSIEEVLSVTMETDLSVEEAASSTQQPVTK
ncbi:Flp pilus assembly complex ATPase component TadA, partial [bacterium]|nr:Flp pilus assembly complex ATPase component TadA [bacterium]